MNECKTYIYICIYVDLTIKPDTRKSFFFSSITRVFSPFSAYIWQPSKQVEEKVIQYNENINVAKALERSFVHTARTFLLIYFLLFFFFCRQELIILKIIYSVKEKSSLINDNEEGFPFFMKTMRKEKAKKKERKVFRIRELVLNDLPFHYSQKLLSMVAKLSGKDELFIVFRFAFFSSFFHIFSSTACHKLSCLRPPYFVSRYDNQLSTKLSRSCLS